MSLHVIAGQSPHSKTGTQLRLHAHKTFSVQRIQHLGIAVSHVTDLPMHNNNTLIMHYLHVQQH